jgi:hypothetical protein
MTMSKKKNNYIWWVNFKVFFVKNSFKKEDAPKMFFIKDLDLLIAKKKLQIHFVESMWLK